MATASDSEIGSTGSTGSKDHAIMAVVLAGASIAWFFWGRSSGTAAVCMLVAIVAAVAELWYGFPAPPIAGGLGGLTLLVSCAVALVVAATRQAPVSA